MLRAAFEDRVLPFGSAAAVVQCVSPPQTMAHYARLAADPAGQAAADVPAGIEAALGSVDL